MHWALLAAWEWSTTETPVMEIRCVVEALQLPAHRNLTAQPVVAHIEELQFHLGQLVRNTPCEPVMVQI